MDYTKPIESLYEHIASLARNNPESPALLGCDEEGRVLEKISYRQLKRKIERIGAWFEKLGLQKGDVLGLAIPNSAEFLLASWSAWAMGVITAPLDEKRDTTEQHNYKLRLSKAKLLMAKKGVFNENDIKKLRIKFEEISELPEAEGRIDWEKDISHQALVLFTSGTTSKPKGAQLSLENLVANADGIKDWFKIKSRDRFMVNLPLHHINSTTFCLSSLLAGASIAIPPSYSKSRFWKQAAETGASFTSIVPTIAYDQLSQKEEFMKFKCKLKLNRIQIGSAPVVVNDVKRFMETFGVPLYQGYGQTETALRVTGVPLELDGKTYKKMVESNCIGKAMKFAEVEIIDDKGNILGEKKDGEIAVKGPIVMKGYLGNHKAFRNGYFLSGDIGYYKIINGERFYYFKGRSKEVIIKGGINISPMAVEDKLRRISRDIERVYVIGVADKRYGEEVAAVICWKKDAIEKAKALLKYKLTSKSGKISWYETPRFITTIDAEKLPTTPTGKVQRSLLKRMNLEFEPVSLIYAGKNCKFLRLTPNQQSYMKQAFELYNYCWQPLQINKNTFTKHAENGIVVVAVDEKDKVRGALSMIRTNLSEKKISKISHAEITANNTLSNNDNNGKKIVCVSICSDNYKPEPFPGDIGSVRADKVKEYLRYDAVYKFHEKAKGGFGRGAKLVSLIPNSRPEDKRALGYNMLMKYPEIKDGKINIDSSSSVATQLAEVVMFFAQQLGIKEVYAFSRPIGAVMHFSK